MHVVVAATTSEFRTTTDARSRSWPAKMRQMTRRVTLVLAMLAIVPAVVGLVAFVARPDPGLGILFIAGLAVGSLAIALGLLVARGAPGNGIAVLLAWHGFNVVAFVTRDVYYAAASVGAVPITELVVAVLRESAVWLYLAVALMLLVFPSGTVPGPRWRWLLPVVVLVGASFQVSGILDPAPFPPPLAHLRSPLGGWLPLVFDVTGLASLIGLLALTVLTAAAIVVRFRRTADPIQRVQLKWLALAGIALPASLFGCIVEFVVFGRAEWLSLIALLIVIAGIPLALAIAIIRHDLYDVDKAIAGILVYGVASAGVVAIYAVASFAAGLIVGQGSATAAAAATAISAVALLPLVAAIRRIVDRRLYPLRRAAREAIDDLARRTHAAKARPEELEAVLRHVLRDPHLRVGYGVPGARGFTDVNGEPVDPGTGVPVVLGGAQIGVLVPGSTAPAAPVVDVAADAAVLVEVVRLRLELSGALRDVESSRTRLVHAGDEERRRLERDLHDGAQQRLVSLGMALRLGQRHLADGTVDVHGLLDQAVAELGTAVAELRRLAHGVRPAGLDDGLREALVTLAQSAPVPVRIDVDADAVPVDLATTAYYVASEAVANALKHADANVIDIVVARADGELRVRVEDDGRGGARKRDGAGLTGLADRVEALGGSLMLRSEVGHGTVVEAVLPCAS
jgi:signal transduction histidine kinase